MEKLIYKTITFYGLQPVYVPGQVSRGSSSLTPSDNNWFSVSDFRKNSSGDSQIWQHFTNLIYQYDELEMEIYKQTPEAFNILIGEINGFEIDDQYSGFMLGYEIGNRCFIIIYCITLRFNTDFDKIENLYAIIRNKLVKDFDRTKPAEMMWANQVNQVCLEIISNETGIAQALLSIPDNTGYIFVAYDNFLSESTSGHLKGIILSNHVNEEINANLIEGLGSQPGSFAFLGWRFSSIFNVEDEKKLRCLKMMIHLQIIYFIYHLHFKNRIKVLFEKIRDGQTHLDLNLYINTFDQLVVAFKALEYNILVFKSDFQRCQIDVYEKVFSYWNLKNDFVSFDQIVAIVQGSLERRLSFQEGKAQSRQNNILFVLALFQLFGLISIFNDYLSLLGIALPTEFNPFVNEHQFSFIKLLLPVVLFVVSILFVWLVYPKAWKRK